MNNYIKNIIEKYILHESIDFDDEDDDISIVDDVIKKYEIVYSNKDHKNIYDPYDYNCRNGRNAIVYQIRALIDIPEHDVHEGDLGGWIESEENLSQSGQCWIMDNSYVVGNAKVKDNALVKQQVKIQDDVIVLDNAVIDRFTLLYGGAIIKDNAYITGSYERAGTEFATVIGKCVIGGNAKIKTAYISHKSELIGDVQYNYGSASNCKISTGYYMKAKLYNMTIDKTCHIVNAEIVQRNNNIIIDNTIMNGEKNSIKIETYGDDFDFSNMELINRSKDSWRIIMPYDIRRTVTHKINKLK